MDQAGRVLLFRKLLMRKCMDIPSAEGITFFKTSTDSD